MYYQVQFVNLLYHEMKLKLFNSCNLLQITRLFGTHNCDIISWHPPPPKKTPLNVSPSRLSLLFVCMFVCLLVWLLIACLFVVMNRFLQNRKFTQTPLHLEPSPLNIFDQLYSSTYTPSDPPYNFLVLLSFLTLTFFLIPLFSLMG